MTKVLFFGTHPRQFNGYSKVVYELMHQFSKMDDIQLSIFGFQNFYDNKQHRCDLPTNVNVYDAFSNEQDKELGFGFSQVQSVAKSIDPDICIVYNDMMVVTKVVSELNKIENHKFKIIAYVDQVYLNQKKMFIDFLNKNVDVCILFTKYWEDIIKQQGLQKPTFYLQHGFNMMNYYPIPKHLARQYFNVKMDDFVILNLNRNQPRKRWDICLKAFAEVISRYPEEPIKMMIGTGIQGSWNLIEIFDRELNKRGMTLEEGLKHLIIMENPQKLSDEETNILYNVADVGINTCDGEGFGLCNFEQAGIGIPQIVSRLGGFIDFFDDENSLLLDPKMSYYVDSTRDIVSGEALLISYEDVADAIITYYTEKEKRIEHGKNARSKICNNYKWENLAIKLRDIIMSISDSNSNKKHDSHKKEVSNLIQDVEEIDSSTIDKIINKSKNKENKDAENKDNANKDVKSEKAEVSKIELLEMQKKINDLLAKM